jgi:formate dehydrogenase alpha subunit
VEVDGRHVPACSTPARDGCRIQTRTPALDAYRRDLAELMMSEARPRGRAADLCAAFGASGTRYPPTASDADGRADASHPYLRLDTAACIKCRLCLSACDDVQGQFVFAFAGRGADAHLTWGHDAFVDTACVACGACASVCPSVAITDVDRERARMDPPVRVVQTTCGYCGVGCQLDVHATDADVIRIEGTAAAAVNDGHLCVKGRYAHGFVRHRDRLTTPLVRRQGRLEPASWDDALSLVATTFEAHRGRVAALSSSRCTNEENYLLQKWMRAGFGTNNVDCCARVCHGPTAAGMRRVFGTGAATNSIADIARADVLLVAGANATEAHPVTGARLRQAALRGAALIVIDPRRTELAAMADVHLQVRPGGNVPVLNSLAAVLLEEGLVDRHFLDRRTLGLPALDEFVREFAPEQVASVTGVDATLVRRAARLWGTARRPLSVHGLGMTEHHQGSEGVMLLCNLALLVGAVGREGVGINPLRGQNNVQGAADMGCQPDLLTGYVSLAAGAGPFGAVWGRPIPQDAGMTIPKMYEAARRGGLEALFILGEDVVQTDPAAHVEDALAALDFLVVQEIFLSETAARADVVLPGASFFEKDGTFTNGERRIQRVRKVLEPPGQARADGEILVDLMARTGVPQSFTGPAAIMDEIASVAPGMRGVSYERLGADGLQWPVPDATHPGTAILHTEQFPLPQSAGKASLAMVAYVPSPALTGASGDTLLLTTGRLLEHYNCGTMTRRTDNVLLQADDPLEIHPDDAAPRGIADGTRVRLRSAWGETTLRARLTTDIRPGTVFTTFHFPGSRTNHVVSDVLDRLADCPEYKMTPVTVDAATDASPDALVLAAVDDERGAGDPTGAR